MRHVREEQAESFLVTISDLMAGLIFLFIITLMIFIQDVSETAARVESADSTRALLLEIIADRLREGGLDVEVNADQGVLRLTENSINFARGDAVPMRSHRDRVTYLARVLSEVLPCFVAEAGAGCPTDIRRRVDTLQFAATIDALLIEGHTDITRVVGGRFGSNMELSGGRAATILQLLVADAPELDVLTNSRGVKVLAISGYGEQRLAHEDPLHQSNRRIDLRFVMEPPRGPLAALSQEPDDGR